LNNLQEHGIDGSLMKVGDRVIVRDNHDEPFLIGHIIRFDDLEGKSRTPLPVVKYEGEDEEYVCFAIVKPYSDELAATLSALSPKEQYNSLSLYHKRV